VAALPKPVFNDISSIGDKEDAADEEELVTGNRTRPDDVIEYIVMHNPELNLHKQQKKSIFDYVKVTPKVGAGYNAGGGGSTTVFTDSKGTVQPMEDKAYWSAGIDLSIPLLSGAEKKQVAVDTAKQEREITKEITATAETYFTEVETYKGETVILEFLHNELDWSRKRVEVGMEHQKDQNGKLMEYLKARQEHNIRKRRIEVARNKLVRFVTIDAVKGLNDLLDGK